MKANDDGYGGETVINGITYSHNSRFRRVRVEGTDLQSMHKFAEEGEDILMSDLSVIVLPFSLSLVHPLFLFASTLVIIV